MNVNVGKRSAEQETKLKFVDCDIHPVPKSPDALKAFLPARWQKHFSTYGSHSREPFADTIAYPRMAPAIARADAWPANGGPPGSDLDFMREQHLDLYGVEYGILTPLATRGPDQRNLEYGAALCTALNDWQVECWIRPEPRLRGSILVPQEDPPAAIAEIERRADDPNFVQVMLPPRTDEPLGRRRYRPIFAAAVAAKRPVALHIGGQGGHAVTGSGWPSYYIEEHHSNLQTMQSLIASLVIEGVFEELPELKVILIESGFAWVAPFCWRLDNQWRRYRDEVPHLKRPPSEYVRQHVWYTTQPIDEPERSRDLLTVLEWVGIDRLMFSTDYPHWDFDDPYHVFNVGISEQQKQSIFRGNAKAMYGLA